MKNKYIIQLDSNYQIEIRNKLHLFFKKDLDLLDKEIEKELELAMNSRLSDIEEIIDITKYINL